MSTDTPKITMYGCLATCENLSACSTTSILDPPYKSIAFVCGGEALLILAGDCGSFFAINRDDVPSKIELIENHVNESLGQSKRSGS